MKMLNRTTLVKYNIVGLYFAVATRSTLCVNSTRLVELDNVNTPTLIQRTNAFRYVQSSNN